MIAVYYVCESGPYHMYTIDVKNDSDEEFYRAIKQEEYPNPDSDVVWIKNNKIVKQEFV